MEKRIFQPLDPKSEEQMEKIIMNIQNQITTMEKNLEEKCKEQASNYFLQLMKHMK